MCGASNRKLSDTISLVRANLSCGWRHVIATRTTRATSIYWLEFLSFFYVRIHQLLWWMWMRAPSGCRCCLLQSVWPRSMNRNNKIIIIRLIAMMVQCTHCVYQRCELDSRQISGNMEKQLRTLSKQKRQNHSKNNKNRIRIIIFISSGAWISIELCIVFIE